MDRNCSKIGSQGAKLVKRFLKQQGNEVGRIGSPHYQMNIGTQYCWVFTERRHTGNISIESWSQWPTRPGWFAKLRSLYKRPQFLFFVCLMEQFPNAKPVIRVVDTEKLMEFCYMHHASYEQKRVFESIDSSHTRTLNLVVPERDLYDAKVLVKVYKQHAKSNRFVLVQLEEYV